MTITGFTTNGAGMTVSQTKEIDRWEEIDIKLPIIATRGTMRVEGPVVSVGPDMVRIGFEGTVIEVNGAWRVFQEIPVPPLPIMVGAAVRVWWFMRDPSGEILTNTEKNRSDLMRLGANTWASLGDDATLYRYETEYLDRNVAAWEWIIKPDVMVMEEMLPRVADDVLERILTTFDEHVQYPSGDEKLELSLRELSELRTALAGTVKHLRGAQ